MAKKLILLLLLLAAPLSMLTGCESAGAPAGTIVVDGEPPVLQVDDYRLGAGDDLRITVFGQEDLTGRFIVSAHGTVAFPLIGEIMARDLTVPQFSALVSERLRDGYVLQPRVNVEVASYRPFYILGEVGQPGTYPFSAGLTVMNAVATAGGFSYRANSQQVFIKHASQTAERRYSLTSTTPVQPGDTVRIAERNF